MKEIIKDYYITKDGDVLNKDGRVLKTYLRNGYPTITLRGKNYRIHRLIAINYIPNPENKPMVNHIDGVKDNNDINNLEWCTAKENTRHAMDVGLFKPELNKPPKLYGKDNGFSKRIIQKDLNGNIVGIFDSINAAKQYCVGNNLGSGTSIDKVLYEGRKTSYGYKWCYE